MRHSVVVAALSVALIASAGRIASAQHGHPPAAPSASASAGAPAGSASAGSAASALPPAEEVLARLKQGNAAFAAGKLRHPRQGLDRIRELVAGQHPLATLLACSDSRVPDELLFDQGIGDLFVVRVAGNVADTDELGTVEYGVDHLGTPLLVVLGHTRCGAVTAVMTGAELHGHIPALVDNILPAVAMEKAKSPGADPKSLVEPAIVRNVLQSMADVITKSSLVRARLKSGQAHMVGALYHLDDGTVDWLGEHPDQADLIVKGDAAPPEHAGPAAPKGARRGAAAKGAAHGAHDAHDDPDAGPAKAHAADAPAGDGGTPNLPIAFAVVAAVACLAGGISSRLVGR